MSTLAKNKNFYMCFLAKSALDLKFIVADNDSKDQFEGVFERDWKKVLTA